MTARSLLLATLFVTNCGGTSFAEAPKADPILESATAEALIKQIAEGGRDHLERQELEQRFKNGLLKQSEVDSLVRALAQRCQRSAGLPDSPLQMDMLLGSYKEFLDAAIQKELVSEEALLELCHAVLKRSLTVIEPLRISEDDKVMRVNIVYGEKIEIPPQSIVPLTLIWTVNDIKLNGESVDFVRAGVEGNLWHGKCHVDLEPGTHMMSATVEFAFVKDKIKIADSRATEGDHWPNTVRKRWTDQVETIVTILAKDKQAAQLVKDAEFDPATEGAVHVGQIAILPGGKDSSEVAVSLVSDGAAKISLSYDVLVRFGDKPVYFGGFYVATWETEEIGLKFKSTEYRQRQGGHNLRRLVEKKFLPDDLQFTDVVLIPNPEHIEPFPHVNKIWGEPTGYKDVPIKRLDLAFKKLSELDE